MGRKHWEQEKLLIMSNFSFSHSVFKRLSFLHSKNQGLFGKGFNSFQNKPWFLRVWSTSLLKTLWDRKKLLVTSNFFFSHRVSYPFVEISAFFVKFEIVVCKLLQFGPVQNLSFWKGLKVVTIPVHCISFYKVSDV